jgi:metallo-beta-lactamase family protein
VIFILADRVRSGKIPQLEVVVESPMASAVTELTLNDKELWDEETRELLKWVSEHPKQINVRFVQDVQDSIALNDQKSGLVIISASGMCEAGRIRHHLKYNIGRIECSIVICGFQAAGTLGRRLVDGVSTVKLFGERIPVRASIHTIGGLSAHADQPALLGWLRHFKTAPQQTFIVHGEPGAASAFADAITEQLGWSGITITEADQTYELK